MIYVGTPWDVDRASGPFTVANEVSVIDPEVPLTGGDGIFNPYQTLSYRTSPSVFRADYLRWLAEDRPVRFEAILCMTLFLQGLERRLWLDISGDPRLEPEVPAIRAELVRLKTESLALYETLAGSDDTDDEGEGTAIVFVEYAETLDETIRTLDAVYARDITTIDVGMPPPLFGDRYDPPMALWIGLGILAAKKEAIPGPWAMAWVWYYPSIRIRESMLRITRELSLAFLRRYEVAYPKGVRLRPGERMLRTYLRPSNPTIPWTISLETRVPDVTYRPSLQRKLVPLLVEAMEELETYARWFVRNTLLAGTVANLAHLPRGNAMVGREETVFLLGWLRDRFAHEAYPPITASELIDLWFSRPDVALVHESDRLAKADAIAFADLLEACGVGIEPDVRWGGSPIAANKPVALYAIRTERTLWVEPSPRYAALVTIVALAMRLVVKDAPVPGNPVAIVQQELERLPELTELATTAERERLAAHAVMLARSEGSISITRRRLDELTVTEKELAAELAIGIAIADGTIDPKMITAVTKLFRALGLDPATVPDRLHVAMLGQRERRVTAPSAQHITTSRSGGVQLDQATILQRTEETAHVSQLLGDIFAEDDVPTTPTPTANASPDRAIIAGLDAAHSDLLRALAADGQTEWTPAAFATLAGTYHLLAAGAIDTLNEFALDRTDDPLIEEGDPLILDPVVLEDLLS